MTIEVFTRKSFLCTMRSNETTTRGGRSRAIFLAIACGVRGRRQYRRRWRWRRGQSSRDANWLGRDCRQPASRAYLERQRRSELISGKPFYHQWRALFFTGHREHKFVYRHNGYERHSLLLCCCGGQFLWKEREFDRSYGHPSSTES